MRIDAYNAISQVYQTTTKAKKDITSNTKVDSDKVEISQYGKDIATAKKAVAEAPDMRMDRVNAIKEQIQNGTYSVSDEQLADKILANFFEEI
ncbi:MAG: flagellar biosynthesis anti-sigma factor FlgM [Lachnospiraceae bacterium]|nr:flagellar biosynthesis anti-sigma factor FlgM [Lachnospiraceae bacterium]